MKRTFYIFDQGDESVGISPMQAEVAIKDNLVDNQDNIIYWKETLSSHYDVPEKQVATEKEMLEIEIGLIEKIEIPHLKSMIFEFRKRGKEPQAIAEEMSLNSQLEKLEQIKARHGRLKL